MGLQAALNAWVLMTAGGDAVTLISYAVVDPLPPVTQVVAGAVEGAVGRLVGDGWEPGHRTEVGDGPGAVDLQEVIAAEERGVEVVVGRIEAQGVVGGAVGRTERGVRDRSRPVGGVVQLGLGAPLGQEARRRGAGERRPDSRWIDRGRRQRRNRSAGSNRRMGRRGRRWRTGHRNCRGCRRRSRGGGGRQGGRRWRGRRRRRARPARTGRRRGGRRGRGQRLGRRGDGRGGDPADEGHGQDNLQGGEGTKGTPARRTTGPEGAHNSGCKKERRRNMELILVCLSRCLGVQATCTTLSRQGSSTGQPRSTIRDEAAPSDPNGRSDRPWKPAKPQPTKEIVEMFRATTGAPARPGAGPSRRRR